MNKPFARGCILVAVVCGALASPGFARASGGLGLDGITSEVGGEVQSALAEADAVAPGTSATAQPAVSQAMTAVSSAASVPSVPAPPAPPTERSAPSASAPSGDAGGPAPQSAGPPTPLGGPDSAPVAPVTPAAPLESAMAEVRTAMAEALGPIFPAEPQHPDVASPARPSPASPQLESPLPGGTRSRDASVVPTLSAPTQAVAFETARAAPRGEGSAARSPPRGQGGDEAPAGAVVPQRPLPPAPPPQGPDMSSPLQSGGQGPLMPLVVGALAAAFALFGFRHHARLVPRSAFRKPRRVVLEVWQPG